MKSANKVLLTLATATAIVAPLVPKSVSININMSDPAITAKAPKKGMTVVEAQCDLVAKTVRGNLQDCEYRCRGTMTTVHKSYMGTNGVCLSPITERILVNDQK